MPESFFRVERRGAVARVTLDRPDKLNALGPAFWEGLAPLMASLDADTAVRCVVLDGAGRAFSSGLDVMAMVPTLPLDLGGGGGSSRVDLQACKLGTGRRFTTS
jgi:Enoyl-CoA hydratase/carnithine racemase